MTRRDFEMTQAQLDKLLDAMAPQPYLIIGGHAPASPQERANAAWQALGREMGFDGSTARPNGRGDRFFSAVEAPAEPIGRTPERPADLVPLANGRSVDLAGAWKLPT